MATKSKKTAASPDRDYVLRITLCESEPEVWRRVRVPGEITLDWLHLVIQGAMGWEFEHLYGFKLGKVQYGPGEDTRSAGNAVLGKLVTKAGTKVRYTYDFGDSWEHEIVTEKIEPPGKGAREPEVLEGAGACPPEDCGGIYNYYDLQEQLADPDHPEREDALDILGDDFDPNAFSLKDAQKRLQTFLVLGPAEFDDEGDEFDDDEADGSDELGFDDVLRISPEESQPLLDLFGKVSGEQAAEFVELIEQGAWMLTCNTLDDIRVKNEDDADFMVPTVAFCVTMKGGNPNIVEHLVSESAQPEEPLIVSLLKKSIEDARSLPKAVVVADEQSGAELESAGFGKRFQIVVSPVVSHMGRVIASDFGEHVSQELPPLQTFAPVCGQEGIDSELAVRYFTAAHEFYDAKPWKGLPPDYAFCLTFPGGEEKHVIVMGQGRMETGLLMFARLEDREAFWRVSQNVMPDPKAMPAMLSISYDEADTCSEELAELAIRCVHAWSRADSLPVTIKVMAGGGFEQPCAADFETLTLVMLTIAACRKQLRKTKRGWPLREGATEEVFAAPAGLESSSVRVRGYRM